MLSDLSLVTRLAWVNFEISIKRVGASRSYSLTQLFFIMGSWYVLYIGSKLIFYTLIYYRKLNELIDEVVYNTTTSVLYRIPGLYLPILFIVTHLEQWEDLINHMDTVKLHLMAEASCRLLV